MPVYLIMITNNDNDFIKESDGKIGGIFSKKVFNYRLHKRQTVKNLVPIYRNARYAN